MSGKTGGKNFSGFWELCETDKYEEWMIDMNVAEEDRIVYLANNPSLEIVHDEDVFRYISRKGDTVKHVRKEIGVEYIDKAHKKNELRVPRWEGDKVVIDAVKPPGTWVTTCEILDENSMLMCYISAGGVVCKRWFKKTREASLD